MLLASLSQPPPPLSLPTPLSLFHATATPEIYTLPLHDALPISQGTRPALPKRPGPGRRPEAAPGRPADRGARSEEHTSELQSLTNLVCRLLLEKKKKK